MTSPSERPDTTPDPAAKAAEEIAEGMAMARFSAADALLLNGHDIATEAAVILRRHFAEHISRKAKIEVRSKSGNTILAFCVDSAQTYVGDVMNTCESLADENEELKRKVRLLHDATIVLRNGYGGHNHWDNTMQHGAGCEVCKCQRDAKDEATKLIDAAAANPAGGE